LSIKNRIIYSSVLLIVLFLTIGMVNWFGSKSVLYKTGMSYALKQETTHLQGIFRGINEFIIDEGEPLSIELTNEHLNGFDAIHNDLLNDDKDPDLLNTLETVIDPQWKIVHNGSKLFMKNNPWISVEDDNAMLEYGKLLTEAKKLLHDVDALAIKSHEEAKALASKVQKVVNIVATVILVLIAFLLYNLYRSITTPIRELNGIAKSFGSGDLNISMNESRKDEFGELASYFNTAIRNLADMISKVKDVTNTLHTDSAKLSSSSQDIAENSKKQSEESGQAATALEEITASLENVADRTADVADSARQATSMAFESADVISGTVQSMNTISRSASESAATIEELNRGSEQIGDIIKVIDDIAGQTNLLALNAAIEAARAGEQGRGFAIVADEVRKLAEKTSASTGQIGEMVQRIQENTVKTIESMQGWTKEVDTGLEQAAKAGGALESIVVSINNVTDVVQQIAASAEEQSTASNAISLNVDSIAELSRNTAESADKSSGSAHELNDLASELQGLISKFHLGNEETAESDCSSHENTEKDDHPVVEQ
jgi:methyl-accepting chemotaxis protein